MNNYALVTWSDGVFLLRSEHSTKEAGIIAYDELHASLVGDARCAQCTIKLLDNQLNIVDSKYFDFIKHAVPNKTAETKSDSKKSSK